jgi:hypothetical protein
MANDSDFFSQRAQVASASAGAVREAFAALPRRGCLVCECRWEQRLEILSTLEACGAFAIRLEPLSGFESVRIVALKGKSGPCYDTGRRAVYRGRAAAVLDDDAHLIVGEIRVCEKTGGFYALSPYRDWLSVTDADPALTARLATDPVPFDCATFDADSRRLAATLENAQCPTVGGQRLATVYPGPFRAVVLADGSVARRGAAVRVSAEEATKNGFLRLPLEREGEAQACESYAAAFHARGAAFVLEPLSVPAARGASFADVKALGGPALAALRAATGDVKRRLLQLIDAREPYWVLTGSDPAAAGGCCPSTTVGEANRLVAAGALQSYAPPAPADACTVTFYAFPGEIGGQTSGEPSFRLLEDVRAQAAAALRDNRWNGVKRAARVGALAVLGTSLGLTAWRAMGQASAVREGRLCAVCEAAERWTHRVTGPALPRAAGATTLGALAALQPCALALLAGTLAFAWRPGVEAGANAARCGVAAAGLGLFTGVLTLVAAWGASRFSGGVIEGLRGFRGPLVVVAGLPLTGLFRWPAGGHRMAAAGGGLWGLFAWGAGLGALACPVGVGLFAGAVLPSALAAGTPVRDALLYGAGYAGALGLLCAGVAAGGRTTGVQTFGRRVGRAAGWGLIALGAMSSWGGG